VKEVREKGGSFPAAAVLIGFLALLFFSTSAFAAGPAVCIYRIGTSGQDGVAFIKRYLEGKGHQVSLYEGEEQIEGHTEKASMINRSGAAVFLAVQIMPGPKSIMGVRTQGAKGDGRFLTIDEVPERFSGDSQALADAVADAFSVKAKQMPLFPLLGITMPGIFLRIQGPETDLPDVAKNLYTGLQKYFRKG
jgi:hypothetical protein